jgi:uncharacterized membrane protein
MTKIEKHVVIERRLHEVARFTKDWRHIPSYFDYIHDVKALTANTAGEGARLLVNLTFLGRKMSSEWEIVEDLQDGDWTINTPLMGVKAQKKWRFEPMGASTAVVFGLEYRPAPRLLGPLVDMLVFRPAWNRLYDRGMRNLKYLIESQPGEE